MPKLLHKNCPYCEKSFQTYEEEMLFCNTTCESKWKLAVNKTPKEENPDYVPLEDVYPKPTLTAAEIKHKTTIRECRHCGDAVKLTPNSGWFGRKYTYCDAHCYFARDQYNSKMNLLKVCKECGSKFRRTTNKEVYCSQSCKYGAQMTARVEEYRKVRMNRDHKDKPERRKISFEELNRRAEKKRLDDEWARLKKWK
jgi:hypothetical protein